MLGDRLVCVPSRAGVAWGLREVYFASFSRHAMAISTMMPSARKVGPWTAGGCEPRWAGFEVPFGCIRQTTMKGGLSLTVRLRGTSLFWRWGIDSAFPAENRPLPYHIYDVASALFG